MNQMICIFDLLELFSCPMFLEIRHLQSLAAIRDSGGVAPAAERLHLTPSALSHQIKALEERCGGALFVRKRRALEERCCAALFVRKTPPLFFTPLGRHFLALAAPVLPEVERAEREGRRLAA